VKKQRAKEERLPHPDLFGEATPAEPAPARASPSPRARPASRTPTRIVTPPPVLLNVREAAARLGLSKSTLDKMRCAGKGPRYVKSTDRAVRYDPADLDAWIAARRSGAGSG
jgi:predicted DNA-binding transcriptional regulator AlpA